MRSGSARRAGRENEGGAGGEDLAAVEARVGWAHGVLLSGRGGFDYERTGLPVASDSETGQR
jgi:hypothetical protein